MPNKAVFKNLKASIKSVKPVRPLMDRSRTGNPEFDNLLGGGFPKGSVILVSGAAGTGKTIFSHQWLFNGAVKFNENGIYITFTEPLFKTLKNLEGMSFYKRSVIEDERIKIIDIRKVLFSKKDAASFIEKDVLNLIESEVKKTGAQRLVIDSITAIAYNLEEKSKIRKFIFDLGTMLATLGCTTILTSEVTGDRYSMYGVEEFISDGILVFKHEERKFQSVRTLEVAKMRGIKFQTGLSTFRITANGIKLFPRLKVSLSYFSGRKKISTGVPGIDKLSGGGVYKGSTNLITGSTGSGKSILGLHFIYEGLMKNEPCLLTSFEESKDQLIRNAKGFGWDLAKYEKKGLLTILCSYPGEKYIEEHLLDIKKIVDTKNIRRCVVDSLSAIGNSFEPGQFQYFAKGLSAYLKFKFVTSLFTTATSSLMTADILTEAHISTLTDNIFLFKYVEVGGEMKLMVSVLKTRGDDHSKSLREFVITNNKGIVVGESFKGYESVMSGSTRKVSSTIEEQLKAIFTEYLGPIGETEFTELKEKGELHHNSIMAFVQSLIKEGSLKQERGVLMKGAIGNIFGIKTGFSKNKVAPVSEQAGKSFFSQFFRKNEGRK